MTNEVFTDAMIDALLAAQVREIRGRNGARFKVMLPDGGVPIACRTSDTAGLSP